jgi:hypothetical protein
MCSFSLPRLILVKLTLLSTATGAFAQNNFVEVGHYFGTVTCSGESRAELVSIIDLGDKSLARVRTFPVDGGPYFQWVDSIHEVRTTADGELHSVQSISLRPKAGAEPLFDLIMVPTAGNSISLERDAEPCAGDLRRLDIPLARSEDVSVGLRGAIVHVSRGLNGFGGGERITDGVDPSLFPIEILSSIDKFGAFITMRSDTEGRSCLYEIRPTGEMTLERHLLHSVGRCTEGLVTYTARGPILVMDWGGGYKQPVGPLTAQDRKIEAFLAVLESGETESGALGQSGDVSVGSSSEWKDGEYAAQVQVGLGQFVDYSVAKTGSGVRIVAQGRGACFYAANPDTGDTYVYKSTAQNCDAGRFVFVDTSTGLTFKFESWEQAITLPFVSGDMGQSWLENIPDVARIKGLALGGEVPQSAAGLDGYTLLTNQGALGRYHRSSMGMLGASATNYLDNAVYHHAAAPQPLPGTSETISFDDLGIYSIDDKVVAVLRYFEPPEMFAPRYDAVQQALMSSYGEPTLMNRSGVGHVYEWHFDPRGVLLPAIEGERCQSKLNGDTTNARNLLLVHEKLETSLQEIALGRAPRIETATVGQQLRVSSECAYSIRYHIHPRISGLLLRMTASMYAHDPVRTEIWRDCEAEISSEIARNLKTQERSLSISPDL